VGDVSGLVRWRQVAPVRSFLGVALALTLGLATLASCSDDDPPDDVPEADETVDLATADLWLSFDDGSAGADGLTEYPDSNGRQYLGRIVAANGGSVEQVEGADGSGFALAFPALCKEPTGCPRAMVEVLNNPALDPEDHPFEYGATVRLEPDQTTTGSNIVQKGRFGTDGGQWKLQVDSDEGDPSCVVRGDEEGAEPLVVRSTVSISDGEWHQVSCSRDADGVSISVDGTVDEKEGKTGSVTNVAPLRIGAPGVSEGDDQFHGQIDDVYLVIDE